MQKTRCTVLLCWMADRSRFMIPVNVFPSTGTILQWLGWRWQEGLAYRRSRSLQTRLTLSITGCNVVASFVRAASEKSTNLLDEIQSFLRGKQEAWNID